MEGKYLPRDLHMLILVYLPVKSLVQFKSVCKSWKTIIEDHVFIETHRLTQAATSNGNCVLIREYDRFSLLHRNDKEVVKCAPLGLPVFGDKDMNQMGLFAPCNGILCLSDGEQDIGLWNPATREFKLLPRSLTPTLALPTHESVNLRTFCIGFGFNPHTDDYKVVQIWTSKYGIGYVPGIIKAEIYSLNADSWRSIISIPTISLKEFAVGEVYLDGIYYWCFEIGLDIYKILCFDMVKEAFEVIDLPDSNSDTESWDKLIVMKNFRTDDEFEVIELPNGNHQSHWDKLILMKDSLAMASYIYSENQLFYSIWAMKEEGALRSWHKFLTLGPLYDYDSPLGFWKDELLFQLERPDRIVSYDYITREIKDTFEKLDVFQMLPLGTYNESLVSISPREIGI